MRRGAESWDRFDDDIDASAADRRARLHDSTPRPSNENAPDSVLDEAVRLGWLDAAAGLPYQAANRFAAIGHYDVKHWQPFVEAYRREYERVKKEMSR